MVKVEKKEGKRRCRKGARLESEARNGEDRKEGRDKKKRKEGARLESERRMMMAEENGDLQ